MVLSLGAGRGDGSGIGDTGRDWDTGFGWGIVSGCEIDLGRNLDVDGDGGCLHGGRVKRRIQINGKVGHFVIPFLVFGCNRSSSRSLGCSGRTGLDDRVRSAIHDPLGNVLPSLFDRLDVLMQGQRNARTKERVSVSILTLGEK